VLFFFGGGAVGGGGGMLAPKIYNITFAHSQPGLSFLISSSGTEFDFISVFCHDYLW